MSDYKIIEKNSSGLVHEFTVTIPAQVIENNIDSEAEKLKDKVNVPGFRKGKAPLKIVRQKHEADLIQNSVESSFKKSLSAIFKEKDIRPAFEPKLDFKDYNKGQDFEFDVYVENTPKFDIPNFKDFTVSRHAVEVTDTSINKELERFQEEMREFKEITSKTHKLKNGEIAIIDFVGKIDGEAFPGGTATDYELELGSKSFIDTFEEQLVGTKVGDYIEVKVNFPENYHAENLKGKPALFEVTIKAVKGKGDLPEVSDNLVEKLNLPNIKTVVDLKKDLQGKLEQDFKTSSYHMSKKDLFDKLEKFLDQDLPPTLLKNELEQVKKADPSIEDKEADQITKRRVALSLLFLQISEQESIKVTQEDYRKAIFDVANRYPGAEMQIVDLYMKNKFMLESLHGSILEEKVVSWIMSQVKFNEVAIKDSEFLELIK
ncbi:trigger factor [Rickettsiales endosymbiont of Stachyamoeba lipophora]|uniref:trigger factor n=1 Tax=Rickettsiales endosymbiont of Stachyamoeba lipophora TaxID=2486578 RepID=UPI000F64832A|nr:trigger factor [Rickettsiales endosymbiont of Stachyamoeba lipophora]AZL15066.1 trigger factor [Rickettsiales endosymbiont of Stachyamoeba lipophora]